MSPSITKTADRLELIKGPQPRLAGSFSDDVRNGLSISPKRLPSKYFYDELGSALFDAITLMPEYYLTRAETEILRDWGWEIVRALGNPIEFIELGSGSAIKTRILIEEALRVQRTLKYSAIDISGEALRASAQALVEAYPALSVTAYAADYFSILGTGTLKRSGRVLAMFMGSNIGNYEPDEARALLTGLGATLKPGDGLLLGTDLKKDSHTLELAYDDATGITAAFNKNLLSRMNRELGANFNLRNFTYVAKYDAKYGRVCAYLQAAKAHKVHFEQLGMTVAFARGERIHTESSYKYSLDDVAALAEQTGYALARSWTDKAKRFSVNLLLRTP
jgi:L-histidine N-alpha-methyltransferase